MDCIKKFLHLFFAAALDRHQLEEMAWYVPPARELAIYLKDEKRSYPLPLSVRIDSNWIGGELIERVGTVVIRPRDQLFVHELADTQVGEFAAVTGILDAAERQVRSRPCGLVLQMP